MIYHLTGRAVIALSGPDARTLLQGLVTNDVEALAPQRPLYAALLAPQGKILFDFLLIDGGAALFLDCPAARAEALAKRLTMYRLRAKVEIALRPDLAVLAAWDGSALPGTVFTDPRHPDLGQRAITVEIPAGASDAAAYTAHRLALGIPEGTDFGSDAVFALDAGLEELHGVSFTKGCYVGQELTARMKHRGTARKRILTVTAEAALPALGAVIVAADKSIGELLAAYGTQGFALIRLDRLEEAGPAALSVGGISVRLAKPDWLTP